MRFRILIVLLMIGIIPTYVMNTIMLGSYKAHMIQQRVLRIQNQCLIIKGHMETENYLDTDNQGNSSRIHAELDMMAGLYDGRVEVIDKNFRIIKDTYIIDENKMCIRESVLKCFKGHDKTEYNAKDRYIESVIGIFTPGTNEIEGVLLMSFPTEDIDLSLNSLKDRSFLVVTLLIIIIVGAAMYISIHLVRPFKKIEDTIDRISSGYLEEKMMMKGYTETEQISEAFNAMLERSRKLEESRQEFVSNVSHELKTPITSIKVLADSLCAEEDLPAELYREFMTDIVAEIDRENEIINDLLTLVKLDKTHADLNINQVNINEFVELILKRLRPIAAKRNIELLLETFRPIIAEVDEVKLTLAVSNIVENAIKYNVLDGWVRVSLNADHKYFYIRVADSGIGIPEDALDNIFERFYRVDKTRSRETGGTGLGLSITQNIIMMHRGEVKVYSKEEGTTFTIRIPLNYTFE